jgi:hypothetical protein
MDQIINIALIVILTTISGYFDAQGAIAAANIWQNGQLVGSELLKSGASFAAGITAYWFSLRFMKAIGIVSPEVQTAIWFTVMIVGVALSSGAFFKWKFPEQIVAVIVISGILWLSIRTGG